MITDAYYLAEMALLCAIPFILIAAGALLRRKFSPAAAAEGAEAAPRSGGRGAMRFLGTFLIGCGIIALLLFVIFILNYLGKI